MSMDGSSQNEESIAAPHRRAGRPALPRDQRCSERMIVTVSPNDRDRYALEADRRGLKITDLFKSSLEFMLAHERLADAS